MKIPPESPCILSQ